MAVLGINLTLLALQTVFSLSLILFHQLNLSFEGENIMFFNFTLELSL